MRDYLDDISDGKAIHGMSYDDEHALICLAYETLSPPSFEPITTPPITEATAKEKTE